MSTIHRNLLFVWKLICDFNLFHDSVIRAGQDCVCGWLLFRIVRDLDWRVLIVHCRRKDNGWNGKPGQIQSNPDGREKWRKWTINLFRLPSSVTRSVSLLLRFLLYGIPIYTQVKEESERKRNTTVHTMDKYIGASAMRQRASKCDIWNPWK